MSEENGNLLSQVNSDNQTQEQLQEATIVLNLAKSVSQDKKPPKKPAMVCMPSQRINAKKDTSDFENIVKSPIEGYSGKSENPRKDIIIIGGQIEAKPGVLRSKSKNYNTGAQKVLPNLIPSNKFIKNPMQGERGKSATQSVIELANAESKELHTTIPKNKLANKFLPPIQSPKGPGQELKVQENSVGARSQSPEYEEDFQEEQEAPITDFEKRNIQRLAEMQEARVREMKQIDEERQKALKRQDKLKNLILQQAKEYKELKIQREREKAEAEAAQQDMRNKSPKRKKKSEKPVLSSQEQAIDIYSNHILASSKEPVIAKTEEELAEERKQKEMMKKFYRNRYSSFLQAIAAKKKEEEKKEEEERVRKEKRKEKLKEKVLGQFAKDQEQEDEENKNEESTALESATLSKGMSTTQSTLEVKKRGSSVNLLEQQIGGLRIKRKPQSRGTQRRQDREGNMDRTLTPKVKRSKPIEIQTAPPVEVYDEVKEQAELQAAAERKARAEQIRARQEKHLKELKDKKEAELKEKQDQELKKKRSLELARQQVIQKSEQFKNAPSLRELQDSRNKKRHVEGGEDSPEKKPDKTEGTMQSFIDRNVPANQVFLNITDMATWKKKNRVDDQTKVFIVRGGYGDVKRALKQRGWVENKDKESVCFDLKWTLKTKDIDTNTLMPNQIVNHFTKATSITTKVGLTHSLKNLIWFNNIDVDTFYPRCFDMGLTEEMDDFVQEFKATKAQGYVKIYVRELREQFESGATQLQSSVSKEVLQVALDVCKKRVRDLDELIDDPDAFNQLVSDAEWKILGADEMNEETLAQRKHEIWMSKNTGKVEKAKKKKKKKRAAKQVIEDDNEEYGIEDQDEDDADSNKAEEAANDKKIAAKHPEFRQAVEVLAKLKENFPQFGIDGERNVWIVKPAGSSRGRGICLYKQLVEILDVCKQIETQYIVQKYIETSLIAKCRKFDIRQWVLVTDWNPLTVWMYAEPYVRFAGCDFDFENLANRYAHLSNNSVVKYTKNATCTHQIEGNMWNLQDLQDHLQEEYGYDVWETDLVEKIKNVIINSLESVQDMFDQKRGQQFELFGYDIMIDEDFNCWLIEVNSSPAMDYSTPVTERLVKMVLEDSIKVVVDYNSAPDKKKKKIDTGLYECIYKAKRIVDKPMASFGLNMEVKGAKIKEQNLSKW